MTSVNAETYKKTLLKHGLAVEFPSPLHMQDLCAAVLSGDVSDTTRLVIEHGMFSSEKPTKRGPVDISILMIPPHNDVVRCVVTDLMPVFFRGTKAAFAALQVLNALHPGGSEPTVKVSAKRLTQNPETGENGDIADAASLFDLDKGRRNEAVKAKSFKHDGQNWVSLGGKQIQGTNCWIRHAAEAIPEDEWQLDPDLWHDYYGRRVLIGKSRCVLGRLVRFVPDKKPAKKTQVGKRRNKGSKKESVKAELDGLPNVDGEVFVY